MFVHFNILDSSENSSTTNERKRKAAKSSSQTMGKVRRAGYRNDKPKQSLDTFVRYPILFQNQMNTADSQAFMDSFRDKCEEGFVAMGYYVDAAGKIIHQRAIRSNIGWVQYKRYLEDLFKFIPDAVFMTVDTTFIRNDYEIIISSEFLYTGTYMVLQPKNGSGRSLKEVESISPSASTSCENVDFRNVFRGDEDDDEVPEAIEDESYLSQLQMPLQHVDWSVMTNMESHRNKSSLHQEEKSPKSHYEWVPTTSANEESGKYILGQFVPSKSKELVLSRDAPFSVAKSSEVSIRGKFKIFINNASYLIRRIEFAYQQDSNDNSMLGSSQ
jgi:hypothetical protein